ncbi:MAG: Mur ligase family protein [Chloroflexota bacterium]|nr:Mur ligase family protein [Chloroflexota bacterium]
MQLAEIRDLDGPNLFMLEPAIKVEVVLGASESPEVLANRLAPGERDLASAVGSFIARLDAGMTYGADRIVVRRLDDPAHLAIAFPWSHRTVAMTIAKQLFAALAGVADDNITASAQQLKTNNDPADRPTLVRNGDRSAVAISVTGTNGKTTTTRLIAHLMRTAGYCTGWNSSSGIYIDGEVIEEGDYSGPSGARRVLENPSIQAAVLETARGGILLRGLGYESNDVSVFTNISADHLDLQGVKTLETLAEVKAVVCKVTRPGGVVVANADDPYVMAAIRDVVARRCLFSRQADNPVIEKHRATGGQVITVIGNEIIVTDRGREIARFDLEAVPITFGGRAGHMIENAMAAIGAALGAGLSVAQIREGLRTFVNDAEHNQGRLNVYQCGEVTVILDFAHNEAGLQHLVAFGHGYRAERGRLITIIGTAGDRSDQSLMQLGTIAAAHSDLVIAKGTAKYLRGRTLDGLMALYREGASRHPGTPYRESTSEVTAVQDAFSEARPGDVIVMMVQEHIPELEQMLRERCA